MEQISQINIKYNQIINKSNVLITPGAKAAIYIAIQMIAEKNSEVLIPDPSFPIYRSAILSSGAKPICFQLKEEKLFSRLVGFCAILLYQCRSSRHPTSL